MDAANAIALVAVAGGAGAAVFGPWRVAKVQANENRLDELRDVLDTGLVTLDEYVRTCQTALTQMSLPNSDREPARPTVEVAEKLRDEAMKIEGRVSLRLGQTHELTWAFREARAAADGTLGSAQGLLLGIQWGPNVSHALRTSAHTFSEARATFVALSSGAIGPTAERRDLLGRLRLRRRHRPPERTLQPWDR
jgi:hypothetical protein